MLQGHAAHTLTLDNGREFAGHERIVLRSQCQVFFADPYSSWQRGTNENTNGLFLQYFYQGREFSKLTVEVVYWTVLMNTISPPQRSVRQTHYDRSTRVILSTTSLKIGKTL